MDKFLGNEDLYKTSKWAREILDLQQKDGSWGYFHTASSASKPPLTTESALRRLKILGYTIDDAPIHKAVEYMLACMKGQKAIPDRREKTHNWNIFTEMMLATWIREFTLSEEAANQVAMKWTGILSEAFISGKYSHDAYRMAYSKRFAEKPRGDRFMDFVSFYPVSLLSSSLEPKTERAFLDYVLNHPKGIYYVYDGPIGVKGAKSLPAVFASKEASQYLGAIELLTRYRGSKDKLQFVVPWLKNNRNKNGKWDLGPSANDKVYFPLSDDWRKTETREDDCTFRVQRLLGELTAK
jgi:hypothetical protein